MLYLFIAWNCTRESSLLLCRPKQRVIVSSLSAASFFFLFSDARVRIILSEIDYIFFWRDVYVSRCLFSHSRFDRALSLLLFQIILSVTRVFRAGIPSATRRGLRLIKACHSRELDRVRSRGNFLQRVRIIALCYSMWNIGRAANVNYYIVFRRVPLARCF